jgi:UDP-N-acetylmuramoylalanine--D-glutamate ligase
MGRSGFAAADALLELGAHVTVVDDSDSEANTEKGTLLGVLGADVKLGPGSSAISPEGFDLVIASPGWHPDHPLLAGAVERFIPVWSEVELAYRIQDKPVPWLGVTGTNGKTTTVNMLTAMLRADGLKVAEVGNIGRPVVEAILDEVDYDVFVVELSSFQLHWVDALSLHSAACLNVQPDHLEWYASFPDPFGQYAADKGNIYRHCQHYCVYNAADKATEKLVEDADVIEGARAVGFTLGIPPRSMMGIVDELLVDRAFIQQRHDSAVEVAKLTDVQPYAPHNVENALAAAALARAFGAHPHSIAQGLKDVKVGDHRIQLVAEIDGVKYIDDSKATNPHAAGASMKAFEHIVWIAGGQLKGTSVDDLVETYKGKLRAVAALGVDRGEIADTMARLAPDVPVKVLEASDDSAMRDAVAWAKEQAIPGDTVLLAPGGASLDMWPGYAARGEAFQKAVNDG